MKNVLREMLEPGEELEKEVRGRVVEKEAEQER